MKHRPKLNLEQHWSLPPRLPERQARISLWCPWQWAVSAAEGESTRFVSCDSHSEQDECNGHTA